MPRPAAIALLLLTAFSLLLCAVGCGSSTPRVSAQPGEPTSQVPTLAELDALGFSGSTVHKGVSQIDGSATVDRAGGRSYEEGSTLVIIPSADQDLAYAVYRQGGISSDKPVQLDLNVQTASLTPGGNPDLPLQYWLGLSDYTTGRWEWIGPLSTDGTFTEALNDPTWFHRYVSAPDGSNECSFSYVVLVTSTGNPDAPNAVKITSTNTTLSAVYQTNDPHFVDLNAEIVTGGAPQGFKGPSSAASGNVNKQASFAYQVRLGWTHVPAVNPSDSRNIADHYDIFRKGPGNTPIEQIDTVAAPGSSYYDPPASGYPNGATQPPAPGADYIYYVQAVNATGGATNLFPTRVLPLPVDPPDAALTADFSEAVAPVQIQFDATASAAAPGRFIANTQWDLDNDGLFNNTPEEQAIAGLVITSVVTIPTPGQHRITVKVFDDAGETDTASFDLLLHTMASATIATVGGGGVGGGIGPDHCLVTLPTGEPAIAYRDGLKQNLKYAVATGGDGTQSSDWTIVDLDPTTFDQFNVSTSLAVVNGKPAIAYYYDRANAGSDIFKYAFSTTTLGANANDWQKGQIDTSGFVGNRCSLADINGVPAVAYQDSNFGTEIHVKYAIALTTNPTSPTDWINLTLQSGNNVDNLVSSLALINGHPAIVYENLGNGDLNYMRSSTPMGSAPGDWSSTLLFARGGSGTFWKSSLHEIDGAPAIGWSDLNGLNYSRALTPDGMNPALWITAPMGVITGMVIPKTEHVSLSLVDGKPAMAFWYNANRSCLGFAFASSLSGDLASDWHAFATQESPGATLTPTLSFAYGRPIFAVFRADSNNNRFIRLDTLLD